MAITYDITQTSGTVASISAVRFEIGDTVDGDGPKPDGSNFTDVEISYMYAQEGSSAAAAAARACEVLARSWARMANEQAGPLSKSYGNVAAQWDKQATRLRAELGGGRAPAFRVGVSRQDGYAYRAGTVDGNP
jgi:hypothetical protein